MTRLADRIAVGGVHRHIFANPDGWVFEIGCFSRAPGCMAVGPVIPDFSWFPGTTWQVTVCGRCGLHLGWHYAGSDGNRFFGLILPRLRQIDAHAPGGPGDTAG